ncbi:MAG TPA: hypothetical protein VFX70_16795 [Mycobacteriales bacterium]|nr:hypothetical protein [Mycobacteriales bacterium]
MMYEEEMPRPRVQHPAAWVPRYRDRVHASADLHAFWVDVMTAHPIHQEPATGAYVCRCGLIASYCPAHRAAIRHRLQPVDQIPWQPLPEDLP